MMIKCCLKESSCTAVYFDGTNYKELYDNLLYKFTQANVVFVKPGLEPDKMLLKDWVYGHGSFDPFGDTPAYVEVDNYSEKPIRIKPSVWVVSSTDKESLMLATYSAEEFSRSFLVPQEVLS